MQGSYVSAGVALASVIGLGYVFIANASPYATIEDVMKSSSGAHVVGQLKPDTIRRNMTKQSIDFTISDPTGTMPVSYTGDPVSNLETATQVVVIGSYKDGVFEARNMQVKCPSKYEAEKSGG